MDNKTRVIQLKDAWGLPGEIEKSDVEIVGIFEWALQSLGVWHDVLLGGHALNATPAFRQPGVQKVLNIFAVGETNLPETKRLRAARWLANTYYRKPIYQDLRENVPDLLKAAKVE